jgi:hypothetical protein
MPNPNTAVFPSAIATDSTFPVATGSFQTILTSAINNSTTTIPVGSTNSEVPIILRINNELILAINKSGNNFINCVRGFYGTTAISHSSGANVFCYITAYHFNQLAKELIAVQTALGVNLENITPLIAPQYIYYRVGIVQDDNPTLAFSVKTATKPTVVKIEYNRVLTAAAQYGAGSSQEMYENLFVPEDFLEESNIELIMTWNTPETIGNVRWELYASEVESGDSLDIPSWTISSFVQDTVPGITERLVKSTIVASTIGLTLSGKHLFFKIMRGTDTAAGPANLISAKFKLMRAMSNA